MIASDIHGSYKCCSELIKRFDEEKCDLLLLLGDILYHGPRNALPLEYDCKKVADLLNSYKERIVAIRGNCDGEVDQMMLDFPILSECAVINDNGFSIYATHGHKIIDSAPFPVPENAVVAFGHTHISTDKFIEKVRYINPGSASIPKGGSERGYIIYENLFFSWKNLDGLDVIPQKE